MKNRMLILFDCKIHCICMITMLCDEDEVVVVTAVAASAVIKAQCDEYVRLQCYKLYVVVSCVKYKFKFSNGCGCLKLAPSFCLVTQYNFSIACLLLRSFSLLLLVRRTLRQSVRHILLTVSLA